MMSLKNRRGVALTVAIMMIICSSILAGYALQAGWNQHRLAISGGSRRDKIYWAAKAGVVHARKRVRENDTTSAPALFPAGTFTNVNYDPDPYSLDLDGNGVNDVTVNIGPLQNGVRQITSTGLEAGAG